VRAPVQRVRGDSFVTHVSEELDKTLWRDVWQANKMDSLQGLPYRDMMMHGRGIMSVWPNNEEPGASDRPPRVERARVPAPVGG
jgi:hypothetical protein